MQSESDRSASPRNISKHAYTMSTLSDPNMPANEQRRKKPMTYGKSSRNTAFTPQSVGSFFDPSSKSDHTVHRSTKLPPRALLPAKRTPSRTPSHKTSTRDEFDVPSSESDLETPRAYQRPTPAKKTAAKPLQKRHDGLALHPGKIPRQQKRKSLEDAPAQKRTRTSSPVSLATPLDSAAIAEPASSTRTEKLSSFPTAEAGYPEQMSNRPRRNATQTSLTRNLSKQGASAPARLNEMLSESDPGLQNNENMTDIQDQAYDLIEVEDLPIEPTAVTPVRRGILRRTTSTTPKQSLLWSQLLPSDPIEPDVETSTDPLQRQSRPSSDSKRQVRVSASKRPSSVMEHDHVPRQARLLDRLKQTTDADEPSDLEGDAEDHPSSGVSRGPAPRSSAIVPDIVQMNQSRDSQAQQSESQASLAQPTSVTKTTYARTRSYLEEDTLEANLMLSLPTATSSRPTAVARRSTPRSNAGGKSLSTFDVDEKSDDGTNGAIRSIHELRAAGSKKRFMDDNAALLDDIKDHQLVSRSRRRSALIELATKLFDKTFLTRFVEHGFDRELVTEFTASCSDPISDAALCVVLALIADLEIADKSIAALHQAGALDVTSRCLVEGRSINQVVKDRRNNMSKMAQSTFLDFAESIRKSSLWGDVQPEVLNTQLLGLASMESMVLRLRRQGNKGGILARDVVAVLVGLTTVSKSAVVDMPPTDPKAISQKLALSVLEFASTSAALSTTWSAELWVQFAVKLPDMLLLQDERRTLALKLCINLTNDNVANCNICAQSSVIKTLLNQIAEGFLQLHEEAEDHEHRSQYDSLILSLGLMTNLAEFSDEARAQTVGLQVNGLVALADVFLQGQDRVEEAQSEEETQRNVPYGFLAVLLGNVCKSKDPRDEVRTRLPGSSLKTLVAAIDEFTQHNVKVDSQTFEGDEGREVWEDYTGRLMAVVTRLQELED